MWNYLENKANRYLLNIKLIGAEFDIARRKNTKKLLLSVLFVDKFILETENPRKDTAIPSVSQVWLWVPTPWILKGGELDCYG